MKNCNKSMHLENTSLFQLSFANKSDISHRHYDFLEFWPGSVHRNFILVWNSVFICSRLWYYWPYMSLKLTSRGVQ